MQQWHPIFSRMVRPILQDDCEVRTTVPVGDLPREADIVVLLHGDGLGNWLSRSSLHGAVRQVDSTLVRSDTEAAAVPAAPRVSTKPS